ncbi:hypothetical protein ACHQM5_015957 [Ranunculus cassubicifolius]
MELNLVEEKGSPNRGIKISRARDQKSMRSNLLDAIAIHGGEVVSYKDEDGTVKLKISVMKKDLMHMLEMIGSGNKDCHKPSAMLSLEQRTNILRKRHLRRPEILKGCRGAWRPVLHSIPEESCKLLPIC